MNPELFNLMKSSVALWVIAISSIVAVAVAVERMLALWRFGDKARALADAVTRALLRGDVEDARAQCERSTSPAAEVFLAGLVTRPANPQRSSAASVEKVVAAVERQRQQLNLRLRDRLWMLGTIGATAPFVGLFGTVWGIMAAFRNMAATGQGGFTVVAAGISEALITTAAGIAVAIEAVVLYNWINTYVQRLTLQFRLLAEEYVEILKDVLPGGNGATPPSQREVA
ncbi:MAG TPA: MotA/TolQ/ExbB proton channel family protein [Anaeromyxobacteraceae bacterium]|nr:MotA/TolQ/ExbB proton channel family protein [Anaeromyxobacteraceae bacterium]